MTDITKAPWTAMPIDEFGQILIRSSDFRTVASVIPQLPTETKRNADLIAAAPVLLCHLEMIMFAIEDGIALTKGHAAYDSGMAAIRRAKGE